MGVGRRGVSVVLWVTGDILFVSSGESGWSLVLVTTLVETATALVLVALSLILATVFVISMSLEHVNALVFLAHVNWVFSIAEFIWAVVVVNRKYCVAP